MPTLSRPQLGLVDISHIRKLLAQDIQDRSHWIHRLDDGELAHQLSQIAQVKRLLQKFQGDPEFRELVSSHPQQAVTRYQLPIDPEAVRLLWDRLQQQTTPDSAPVLVQRCLDFAGLETSSKSKDLIAACTNPNYIAWRLRQTARTKSQIVAAIHEQIGHFPVAFELSKGCSVGCWFCSVSAPRLEDIFFYTPENAKLWREVLTVLKQTLGSAAGDGFCYWASDPLDNPDYEKFLCDFHAILGVFPQTTTAQPLKDPQRTRSLLRLSLEKGCRLNRFSILSLKMLLQVHQEFTAEELAFVGLVQQHKEAGIPKANAGRMRERTQKQPDKRQEVLDESVAGTNACVTGFLFNMVDRTVKLVSPCPASERWPNGYWVYQEARFDTAEELKQLLEEMIETHMPLQVRSERLRFRPDLHYQSCDDGFEISTHYWRVKFRHEPYFRQLGELILAGDRTVEQIVSLFRMFGIPAYKTLNSLNLMFSHGIFDDEPQA